MTCQLQNLAIEIDSLLLDGLTCLEQRPDHGNQLGAILDQFLRPHRKDIELGTADHETDVLEQATDLVLEIALDLDQQRPARQQRPNRVAIEALDAHLLKPAGLHDAGDAGRIVAVTLIDLHLEYRSGMARVDTDHRQAKLFELAPQPCGRRSVSRPTRTTPGAFDLTNAAIASGSEPTTPSRPTDPAWFTTQIDVCFNDTSSPT